MYYMKIGPTASWGTIGITSVLLIIASFFDKMPKFLYFIFIVICVFLGSVAIYGGFTKDISNWPNEFWRWAGIAVNSLPILAFVILLKQKKQINK